MDFSSNLHHQLLQLENQLLVAAGTSHAWTPDITLSPSCDFEPNFHLQDMNPEVPAAIDAEISLRSLQHYYSHGSKDQRVGEAKDEEEASASETLNSHSISFEDVNKIAALNCCCSNKIHPTVNVSSRKPLMADLSSSLAFEFDHSLPFASHHHQLQKSTTSCLLTKKMASQEITQANTPCTLKQHKPTQSTLKRTRVEPRATCPPLKIRKEKLGDRIAALQQLVAPFGKTDTASVLMEAISYINFLQNQVEMLSHSYMKSCRSNNYKTTCRDELNDKNKELESDLKTRGLCLVPLTCISYLPEDAGGNGRIGNIWPPLAMTNFNRRTF